MNEKYYYLRNTKNEPVVTVCILKEEAKFARGVAVCSDKDISCKRIGRAIAKGRAKKAFRESGSSALVRRGIARDILHSVGISSYWNSYKSHYLPHLSGFETNLWEDKR